MKEIVKKDLHGSFGDPECTTYSTADKSKFDDNLMWLVTLLLAKAKFCQAVRILYSHILGYISSWFGKDLLNVVNP